MARAMKASGVKWIETIPQTWAIVNLRQVFSFGKGLPITKEDLTESGIPVISYGQIHSKINNGITIRSELIRFVDDGYVNSNPESLVYYNDFIFADTSEDLEGCGNSVFVDVKTKLFAGYHTIILRNNNDYYNKYFAFLFQSDAWRKQIRERATGVKVFSISQKILRFTTILLPPIAEQYKIADYLDPRCAEIDHTITEIEKTIEEYKALKQSIITEAVTKGIRGNRPMKDSGNQRWGTVPIDWKMARVKNYVISFSSGLSAVTEDNSAEESGKYVLRTSSVSTGFFKPSEVKPVLISAINRLICPVESDTLIVSRMNTSQMVGACAYVEHDVPNTYLPDKLWKIKFSPEICTKYFWYSLNSTPARAWFSELSTGSSDTMQNISTEDFVNNCIPIPPVSEQRAIVAFLDDKCSEIGHLIAQKEELLLELTSYKKSLIYEYVTGKKEVPV